MASPVAYHQGIRIFHEAASLSVVDHELGVHRHGGVALFVKSMQKACHLSRLTADYQMQVEPLQ